MKAIIIAPVENANAVLPPMDGGDELRLTYDDAGTLRGGFTLVGNVPMPNVHTCLVLVHTSPTTLDAMIDSGEYLFVEEIAEPESIEYAPSPEDTGDAYGDIVSLREPESVGTRTIVDHDAGVDVRGINLTLAQSHQLPGRAAVVQWLRDHGYSPALLNAAIPPGAPAHGVRRGLREIHQVSESEYARAR